MKQFLQLRFFETVVDKLHEPRVVKALEHVLDELLALFRGPGGEMSKVESLNVHFEDASVKRR